MTVIVTVPVAAPALLVIVLSESFLTEEVGGRLIVDLSATSSNRNCTTAGRWARAVIVNALPLINVVIGSNVVLGAGSILSHSKGIVVGNQTGPIVKVNGWPYSSNSWVLDPWGTPMFRVLGVFGWIGCENHRASG